MKAVAIHAFGDAFGFVEAAMEMPAPGEHDLLVEVYASAVNPVDTKIRRGFLGERPFPLALGYDVSGVVRAVGSSVKDIKEGDEVIGCPSLRGQGSNAEFCLIDSRRSAPKPKSLDHVHAAAVPLVALTAWEVLVMKAEVAKGQAVLVQAGAGGVGHIAIQIAKHFGAIVFATASTPESMQFCTEMGADHVINYKTENVVERVKALTSDGLGVDIAMDNVGSTFETSVRCVRPYGCVTTIAGGDPTNVRGEMGSRSISWHMEFMDTPSLFPSLDPSHQGAILRQVSALMDEGKLKVHVSEEFEFSAAGIRRAHQQQESGKTIGKLAIVVKK